jgi:hypothetical protein
MVDLDAGEDWRMLVVAVLGGGGARRYLGARPVGVGDNMVDGVALEP